MNFNAQLKHFFVMSILCHAILANTTGKHSDTPYIKAY